MWRLCADPAVVVDFAEVGRILPAKCAVRGVETHCVDDFFPELVVEGAGRQWGSSLANLVRPLPEFAVALGEIRASLIRCLDNW